MNQDGRGLTQYGFGFILIALFVGLLYVKAAGAYYYDMDFAMSDIGAAVCGINRSAGLFYNPSSLADINKADMTIYYNPRFNMGLYDSVFSADYPFYNYNIFVGMGGVIRGARDEEDSFKYSEQQYNFSWASRFKSLNFGMNVKLYHHSFSAYGYNYGSGFGWGFDLGFSGRIQRLRYGLALLNLGGLRVAYDDQSSGVAQDMIMLLGTSYKATDRVTTFCGVNTKGQISLSGEYNFPKFLLRGGLLYSKSGNYLMPFAGFYMGLKNMFSAFNFVYHPYLGIKSSIGLGYYFAFRKLPVTIEKVDISSIIPAFYGEKETLGKVVLKNNEAVPLAVTVKMSLKEHNLVNTEIEVDIPAKSTKEVLINLDLPEELLFSKADRIYTLQVSAVTEFDGSKFVDKATQNMLIYSRNAFIWNDVLRLAAFVLPNSSNVLRIKEYIDTRLGVTGKQPLKYIVAAFDLLGKMGVTYINDPVNPFAQLSEISGAIDNVQLPFETLSRGAGDCDDDVVLLCSVYEAAGLKTYFVDLPNHLMLLVGTGLRDKTKLGRFAPFAVKIEDEYFIPVEATKIGLSIYDAVEDAYKTMQERRYTLYNVEQGLGKYERQFKLEPVVNLKFPEDVRSVIEDLKYVD